MKRFFFVFVSIFFLHTLHAQQAQTVQRIYLTDGSFLRGIVMDTIPSFTRTIRLVSGTEVIVPLSTIRLIEEDKNERFLLPEGKTLPVRGQYFGIFTNILTANSSAEFVEETRWGFGAHFVTGYQFHHYFSVGGGIGLDTYEELFLPLFAEVRGFAFRKKNTPTFSLQAGYSLPIGEWTNNEEDDDVEKINGGFLLYPSIGLHFAGRREASFQLDVGYKFQQYRRTYKDIWWWGGGVGNIDDKVWLKSFAIRLGWIF